MDRGGQIMVAIIIVSFNHFLFTKACVESIVKNTPKGLYEICLVDNGSNDGTVAWASGACHKVIGNLTNRGAAAASNQGCEWALDQDRFSHILVMANDHVVTNGWLTNMLNAPTDCVNPFVFHSVKEIRDMYPPIGEVVDRYKPLRLKYLQKDSKKDMDYVLNATYGDIETFASHFRERHLFNPYRVTDRILWPGLIMYKKKVLETVGLKDEEYLKFDLASYADIDHYVRVRLAGFTTSVVMTSYVHHWGSITTRKLGLKQEGDMGGYKNNEAGAYQYFIKKWGCDPHNLDFILLRRNMINGNA
jgi:GT2 family glycosyltransferase